MDSGLRRNDKKWYDVFMDNKNKKDLENFVYRSEFELLKERVEQVEKILQVMAKKSH